MSLLKDDPTKVLQVESNIEKTKQIYMSMDAEPAIAACEWIAQKAELQTSEESNKLHIFNNHIYWAYLGVNIGSEQNKSRPVLVVQTRKEWHTCIIIPLSTQRLNDSLPYHVDLENTSTTALVEQIRTISKKRIYKPHYKNRKVATITQADWDEINRQLSNICFLKPLYRKNC